MCITIDGHGEANVSPLLVLASNSGYSDSDYVHILEKAIVLLKWGMDVSCRDVNGNTVLHRFLSCNRRYWAKLGLRPFLEPRQLLKVLIAAGADIYALNNAGRSASRTARNFGRETEWFEALEFCGINPKEVVAQTLSRHKPYTGQRQSTTVKFDEYYKTWDEKKWARKMSWDDEVAEEVNDGDALEPGLKDYYRNKMKRWDKRYWRREKMERNAGGSRSHDAQDCCCSAHSSKAPENMEDEDESKSGNKLSNDVYSVEEEDESERENERESEVSNDGLSEYSSDIPLDTWGYSSGDDSDAGSNDGRGHGFWYGPYEEGLPRNRVRIYFSTTMDPAEHMSQASTASTVRGFNSISNDIAWQPMDPPLFTDETQSRADSWRYTAMEQHQDEQQLSINGMDFLQEVEAPFEGAFQTEFDTYMADDES